MSTQDNYLWLFAVIHIVALLFVCLMNIGIHSRYRHSVASIGIHLSSAFFIAYLFCHMVDLVIPGLPFESIYKSCATAALFLFAVSCAGNIVILFHQWRKEHRFFNIPPNLEMIFTSVDDLAFVADYKGNIIQVNHPQKFDKLLNREKTLTGIFDRLRNCFCKPAPLPADIVNSNSNAQHEIHINETGEYYQMIISPIFSGEIRIGFSVLFFDITVIRKSEITLREQNILLEEANSQLVKYVSIAGELEAQNERLHILRNILTNIIIKIEASKVNIHEIQNSKQDSSDYRQSIREIADELRNIYKDVRASVNQIAQGDKVESNTFNL